MSSSSILDQSRFWEIIGYLVTLDSKKSFDDICKDLSITKPQLNSFIHFLKEVDYHLDIHADQQKKLISSPEREPKITVEFSLLEWLQFQANCPAILANRDKPYFEGFADKLVSLERQYHNHDLFHPLQKLEKVEGSRIALAESPENSSNKLVSQLEEAIMEEKCVEVKAVGKLYNVYPRLVVFIEGNIGLIAETISDSCIIKFDVSEIDSVSRLAAEWNPTLSRFEVDEFVLGLRAICENEVRLILKVFSLDNFHLQLRHQLFGNPCMVTNPNGEMIWAASVEPSEVIFDWIYSLGSGVEIIDPKSFKKEYLQYCESKLKKLA